MNIQTTKVARPSRLAVSVAVCVALLSGCEFLGLDSPDPAGTQQADKADDSGAAPPPKPTHVDHDEGPEYERPDYPDNVRRNPFMPDLEVVQPDEQIAAGDIRPLQPLEKFAIGDLTLVAIISEVAVPKAMFLDPNGFGHVVKEGDRVGQNGGTITDVRDNEVEVREITDDKDTQTRLTTVELRSEQLNVQQQDGLTEQERKALRDLMGSKEGRQAVKKSIGRPAKAASGSDEPTNTFPPRRR